MPILMWALGALGLTGGGIGIAALLGGGPWLLMAAKWLWSWVSHATFLQILCIALAVFGLVQTVRVHVEQRHSHKLEAQIVKIAADAKAQKAKIDAANRQIADEIRKRTDEENRRIAADADGLRLSGPGRSRVTCAPAASGGHITPGGKPDAAGPQVSPDDLAAVPWPWLVQRAETNDLNRVEVLAWRDWYDRLLKQWPKN